MNLTHLQGRATISVSDAAALLGISRNTAYDAARSGQLPILRLGHRLLVPVPALLRMLESEETREPAPGQAHRIRKLAAPNPTLAPISDASAPRLGQNPPTETIRHEGQLGLRIHDSPRP